MRKSAKIKGMPIKDNVLAKELETFDLKKGELLAKGTGKFVLIKDDKVIDIFDTQMDAINQGYERFKDKPFLVKQIMQVDKAQNFTTYNIAI
jgi:chitinase